MDWRVHANLTNPDDFWDLWDANQDAFTAIAQTEGVARSGVAALTLLTWDVLTTLDDEVKLIWRSQWTLPKVLYLFVRYFSLITLILDNIRNVFPCMPWLVSEILATLLVELAAQVIIILRVYAIYATKTRVLRVMLGGFAVQVTLMTVSLGISMPKIMAGFYCKAADLPAEMVLFSTASIVYETFLFGLMMVEVTKGGKDDFGDATLMTVLVRDGTLAYVGIFSVMLLNTILFTMAPTTLVLIGFPWVLAIVGVAGSRLILNLRAKHATNISGPSSLADLTFTIPSHMYSIINFEDPDSEPMDGPEDADEDSDTDREDAALNPSRTNTTSSHSHSSACQRARDLGDAESTSSLSDSPHSPLPLHHPTTSPARPNRFSTMDKRRTSSSPHFQQRHPRPPHVRVRTRGPYAGPVAACSSELKQAEFAT
ncbi:hypothetical protein LXA43DRAFT_357012 [Ganoderma leucocontextum]|nr:hypothetical protein LXA43DRAFT_357012 [Ganoderma leucocontextum]